MKRKICVITGSRAEYYLLRPLLYEIKKDKGLFLQLVVTGMHLSPEFGLTYREIVKDDFQIHEKVEVIMSSDTPTGVAKSIGLAIMGFSEAYVRLKPDIIVVLGDRFEIFGAVSAALVGRYPVAHLMGGEVTEGAYDDSFRHCITKMSHLHFVATQTYRKRVIQLGEDPSRVFNVGALNIDCLKRTQLIPKYNLEKKLNFKFRSHNLLVTFHPSTLEAESAEKQFNSLLGALETFKEQGIIFTKSNADEGGRRINSMIDEFVMCHPQQCAVFTSLGQQLYFSVMRQVDMVVGNSSSGILEAPSFKIATVNIGDRQKGRIKCESVIDCQAKKKEIIRAINFAISSAFRKKLSAIKNPFGDGKAAFRIKKILKEARPRALIKKSFFDINFD